ncbi:hypothetical protein [uncultured Neptuniibacter sp.]|uniref:hypothetical protein n=1 Tax=uncultured Neptuniibacter sp. TaxID=502143 RepID=UPI00261E7893|nr:hypothetical protein [uncultured Neptuniibacter sp.]
MRKLIPIIFLLMPLYGWAGANEADLAKCREYINPAVRSQCVQLYKKTSTRVAFSKCKKSLDCWSKRYRKQAEQYCSRAFEMRAARSQFWNRYWNGQDFDKVRWLDESEGAMVYFEEEGSAVLNCFFYPNAPSRVKVKIASKAR